MKNVSEMESEALSKPFEANMEKINVDEGVTEAELAALADRIIADAHEELTEVPFFSYFKSILIVLNPYIFEI